MSVRPALEREMKALGEHARAWRKINGLTTEMVAERARISRDTLRALENGRSVSSENLLAVLQVLGILQPVVDAANPVKSEFGVRNLGRASVERVRVPSARGLKITVATRGRVRNEQLR